MKTIRTIIAVCLLGGCCTLLQAQTYAKSVQTSSIAYSMQSTSTMMPSSYHVQTYSPGATGPAYVAPASGDLDPFGVSGRAGAPGIRKGGRPTGGGGKTDGDKENPDIDGPITDGTWFLLLLGVGYIAWRVIRRRKTGAAASE